MYSSPEALVVFAEIAERAAHRGAENSGDGAEKCARVSWSRIGMDATGGSLLRLNVHALGAASRTEPRGGSRKQMLTELVQDSPIAPKYWAVTAVETRGSGDEWRDGSRDVVPAGPLKLFLKGLFKGLVRGRNSEDRPMNAASRTRAPTTQKRTVSRGRLPNAHYRTREYLTEKEVERLIKAAGDNRHGHRDATMILLAFRHGLRASSCVRSAGTRSI